MVLASTSSNISVARKEAQESKKEEEEEEEEEEEKEENEEKEEKKKNKKKKKLVFDAAHPPVSIECNIIIGIPDFGRGWNFE